MLPEAVEGGMAQGMKSGHSGAVVTMQGAAHPPLRSPAQGLA